MYYLGTLFLKVVLCSTIPQCASLTPLKEFSSPVHADYQELIKYSVIWMGHSCCTNILISINIGFLNVLLLSEC